MPDPRNILIIKPSSLGDVATTLPLLCDLRAAYPDARIDWLIHPAFTALVQGHDAINNLILFDRKKLGSWWYNPRAFGLFCLLRRQLRDGHFDLVIDAQGLFRSGYLARRTGAKTRIGFAHAREGATFFYTHKVSLPDAGKHMIAVDRMRALLAPLNIAATAAAQFRLPIQPAAAARAEALLRLSPQSTFLSTTPRFAAIIPGARWDTKRWSIEGYTEIARRLASLNLTPVLLGSPDERPLCDQIASTLSPQASALRTPINLAGQTSLAEMVAILARASLVIGNDSGPLHVAVALGKPCVSIYGPTAPEFVGPYGQLENVLRHPVDCHPCRQRTCDHHSCMKGVTVEAVWEKTVQLTSSTPSPGRTADSI